MAGVLGVPLPALVLFLFSGIYVWFGLRAYREDVIGSQWFVALMAASVVWSTGYGLQLLLADPTMHLLAAGVAQTGTRLVPILALFFFLVFAGQERYVRPLTVAPTLVVPLAAFLGHATQDSLGLVYAEYRLVATSGVTTLVGQPTAFELGMTIVSLAFIVTSAGVLFWTVYRYWSLYRQHVPWLVLLYVVTVGAFVVYTTGNAPIEGLRLVPYTAPLQAVVYANILFRNDYLGISSRTRTVGRRAAMETLEDGVAITDEDWRLADYNAVLAETFDLPDRPVGTPLVDVLDESTVGMLRDGDSVRLRPEDDRVLDATATAATDQHGDPVGHVVLLRDVTELQRRGQRLSVLNRVMRHNLRNEMTIVKGNAELIEDTQDGRPAQLAAKIRDSAEDVVDLGDKARSLEEVLDSDQPTRTIDVTALTRNLVDEAAPEDLDVTFTTSGQEATVRTRPSVLATVLRTVLDNAAEHNDSPDPTVEVDVTRDDRGATVTVADNGPGIPKQELAVLENLQETDLEHGSGLGLWLVRWGVEHLGGSVEFTVDDGTIITVRIPDGNATTDTEDARVPYAQ